MSISNLKFSIGVFITSLIINGCVKFEDPALSLAPEPVSYASPCTADLNNDFSLIYTATTDLLIGSYDFSSPNCNGTFIEGNPSSGTFQILLGSPITESGTYDLEFNPFPQAGEAQIQFAASGFAQPVFTSNNGILHVDVQSEGTIILEWCDVICFTVSGLSNQKTSGRMVCQ